MRALRRAESLDRYDFLAGDAGDGSDAGSAGSAVDVNGARSALPEPAAELGAVERELVAQDVEQWRVRLGGDVVIGAVHADAQRHQWLRHEDRRFHSDV